MIKLNNKMLLRIAKLSALKLTNDEIPKFTKDLNKLLKYVEQLRNIKISKKNTAIRNTNIFRDDKAIKQDPTDLLNQAPKMLNNYFVIPTIRNKKDN